MEKEQGDQYQGKIILMEKGQGDQYQGKIILMEEEQGDHHQEMKLRKLQDLHRKRFLILYVLNLRRQFQTEMLYVLKQILQNKEKRLTVWNILMCYQKIGIKYIRNIQQ